MKKIMLVFMAVGAMLSISACGPDKEKSADENNSNVTLTFTGTVADAHNSQNSLDWNGVYIGTIPAADAEGIKVQLVLNTDETYTLTYEYIGKDDKPYTDKGKFTWEKNGNVIRLDHKDAPPYYQVGENQLLQLDMEGKVITGDLAEHYILKKAANTAP